MTRPHLPSLGNELTIGDALQTLEKHWATKPDYMIVLDAMVPAALSSFSHQYSSMHVPKANEYLRRILGDFSPPEQLIFLKRYLEYLVWSPKYRINFEDTVVSDISSKNSSVNSFLHSLEQKRGLPALHYIQTIAEDSLEDATRTLLRVGCIDVSQAIGHYFSCTESMINLALSAGMPRARHHLFTATLYLMQSRPMTLERPARPTRALNEILSELLTKTGFIGYHYMILANGLINQRDFLGEQYYQHALAGLEKMLSQLPTGMTPQELHKLINTSSHDDYTVDELRQHILNGNKSEAFATVIKYYNEHGITHELQNTILSSYTWINDHPPDPHYVTVPTSLCELSQHLNDENIALALVHSVEFAINRIRNRGIISQN
jgi:hypothetical protein